ncbi:MAG: Uma2 family endonuclease [Blastocatellia bacterium]
MNWHEACAHPGLRDLPFKVELNEWGQIVMSPIRVRHAVFQGRIMSQFHAKLSGGAVLAECAVETSLGVRVADVAWVSDFRLNKIRHEAAASISPEICVEVFTEISATAEMEQRRRLYFESSAREVWFCSRKGVISFFDTDGKLKRSALCPDFPPKIES